MGDWIAEKLTHHAGQPFCLDILNRKLKNAVYADDLNEAEILIERGAKPDDDMLVFAVAAQKHKLSALLLDNGVKPNQSLMVLALENRDQKTVDLLLKYKTPLPEVVKPHRPLYGE